MSRHLRYAMVTGPLLLMLGGCVNGSQFLSRDRPVESIDSGIRGVCWSGGCGGGYAGSEGSSPTPLADWTVGIFDPEGSIILHPGMKLIAETRTDKAGRFHVSLKPGAYLVWAGELGCELVEVLPGQVAEVRLTVSSPSAHLIP